MTTQTPDTNLNLSMFVTKSDMVCLFHERPFSKAVSWLEYDTKTGMLDFVLESGEVRNFGVPVAEGYKSHMHKTATISLILRDPDTKKVVQGIDLPLVVQTRP